MELFSVLLKDKDQWSRKKDIRTKIHLSSKWNGTESSKSKTLPSKTIDIIIIHGRNGDGDGDEDEDGSEWCQATCQATCQSTTLFICTSPPPTTATQVNKLDYCHHPQIDFCCLGFLDVSNWILILSSFITRDIRRTSLMVLLLRSTTWLFFSNTLSHTQNQNAFFDIVVNPF